MVTKAQLLRQSAAARIRTKSNLLFAMVFHPFLMFLKCFSLYPGTHYIVNKENEKAILPL